MHILILESSPGGTAKMRAAVRDVAERCEVVAAWSDVVSRLANDPPDVVLAARAALAQMELPVLLRLTQPGYCPPLVLVDPSAAEAKIGVTVGQRFSEEVPPCYEIGELRIDTRRKRATVGERWVALPPIQYRLLLALARRAGEVVDCRELIRTVWGYDAEQIESRELVKVHIRQIRRRLGLDPESHYYIHSVRGFGYMLAPPEES